MVKEIMTRKSVDNIYLHKDFHGALNMGIQYIHQHYGEKAVRDFLRQFALSFHAPMKNEINQQGLIVLKEYFEKIYRLENGKIKLTCSENELLLEVEACPAVQHMRQHGSIVSSLFVETTKTVNEAICEGTPFSAELVSYDRKTGRSVQRFYRRKL